MEGVSVPFSSSHSLKGRSSDAAKALGVQQLASKPNQVGTVLLYGIPIVSLVIECTERLCLAQISNTLLKQFSYNEIHNRRVALGITCVQCTPVQLEILRRAGAMPVSSRRCGMITRREAERLCKSFLGDNAPPRLPEDFAFAVHHECAWGCRGAFLPARYNSSRAKCIKCSYCGLFFSPNKFIFHSHRVGPGDKYIQPDAANFNSWRRHMKLSGGPPDEIVHAWEDVKAMFNGGTRKRMLSGGAGSGGPGGEREAAKRAPASPPAFPASPVPPPLAAPASRVPPFADVALPLSRSLVMDYVWHQSHAKQQFAFAPYALPWLKRGSLLFGGAGAAAAPYQSAFRPVQPPEPSASSSGRSDDSDDEPVDIESTGDESAPPPPPDTNKHEHDTYDGPGRLSPLVLKTEREEAPPLKHGIRQLTRARTPPRSPPRTPPRTPPRSPPPAPLLWHAARDHLLYAESKDALTEGDSDYCASTLPSAVPLDCSACHRAPQLFSPALQADDDNRISSN